MTDATGTTTRALPEQPTDTRASAQGAHPDGPGTAELRFEDLLDVINPLQHLPVVSTIYRALSGDEISTGARFAGGLLYGGPIGVLATGLTALVEEATGGRLESHLTGSPARHDTTSAASSEGALEDAGPAAFARVGPAAAKSDALHTLARDLRGLTLNHGQMPPPPHSEPSPDKPDRAEESASRAFRHDREPAHGRARHPNLAPPGASGSWYAEAMQRALQKYRATAHAGAISQPGISFGR